MLSEEGSDPCLEEFTSRGGQWEWRKLYLNWIFLGISRYFTDRKGKDDSAGRDIKYMLFCEGRIDIDHEALKYL